MKEFIYLDTDYLTSALAQINQGNILSFTHETSEAAEEGTTEESETQSSTQFGLKALLAFAAQSHTIASDKNAYSNLETAKDVVTKTFDDYSYDVLYQYISAENQLKTTDYEEGDFVMLSGDFKLVDYEFVLTLLGKGFVDIYVENEKKQYESGLNREQTRGVNLKDYEKTRRQFYEKTKKSVETLKQILPSNIILQISDIFAPIKEKFLRGGFKDISFKYDHISVLARITRRYAYQEYTNGELLINAVDHILPTILAPLSLNLTDGSFIATPIAIYIE